MIRRLVDDAWKDPVVNRTAIDIVRNAGAQEYDSLAQIHALYNFAHSFYFVNDPVTKEALRPARELLNLRAGDCDDINAIVLPSLLGSVGFEVRLVTIAADPQQPETFSHVYCEVFLDGTWMPLDAARPGAVFGEAPPHFYRREWWSLVDANHGEYSGGLGGYIVDSAARLNGGTSIASAVLTDTGNILKSVGGQTVQNAVQGAIGPGGANSVSPNLPSAAPSIETDLLILAAAVGLIWWLSQ